MQGFMADNHQLIYFGGILILIFFIIGFYFWFRLKFLKNYKILQKQVSDKEEQIGLLKKSIELKEMEISIVKKVSGKMEEKLNQKNKRLKEISLILMRNYADNKTLIDLAKELKKYCNKEGIIKINSALTEIEQNIVERNWNAFKAELFDNYENFFKVLDQRHPGLTDLEKRYCAFIKMGLASKDIETITLQTPSAIYTAKSRLRKKIGLDDIDELTEYLSLL